MAGDPVLYESREGIAYITLNRPAALNAMDEPMIGAMHAAWLRYNESGDQCAIVRGAGERAFSAGLDMRNTPKDYWRGLPGIGVEILKPIVAAVDGHCIGSGFVLTQMCDLVVATDRAQFSYPEAQIGYTSGIIVGVVARIPHKIAMEFMLAGERFSAKRAYEVGMINQVVAPGQELKAAERYARILADSAPLVVRALKSYAQQMTPRSAPELAALARRPLMEVEDSEDRLEGQAAFRDRRRPAYKGR